MHGDIRSANLVFATNARESCVIDFDFSGRIGKTRYPRGWVLQIDDGFRVDADFIDDWKNARPVASTEKGVPPKVRDDAADDNELDEWALEMMVVLEEDEETEEEDYEVVEEDDDTVKGGDKSVEMVEAVYPAGPNLKRHDYFALSWIMREIYVCKKYPDAWQWAWKQLQHPSFRTLPQVEKFLKLFAKADLTIKAPYGAIP